MSKRRIYQFSIIALVVGFVFLANGLILAWTAPTEVPPGGNVPSPVNVGITGQNKSGRLGVSASGVDSLYGLTVGTGSTYGIKSDRWSWFGAGLQAAGWDMSDNNIYNDSIEVIHADDDVMALNRQHKLNEVQIYDQLSVLGDSQLSGRLTFSDDHRGFSTDSSYLRLTSDDFDATGMSFYNKASQRVGWVYGSGSVFGLLDGDGEWSYHATKDVSTSFLIDNQTKLVINKSGSVRLTPTDSIDPATACTNNGEMFYDDSDDVLYLCSELSWLPMAGGSYCAASMDHDTDGYNAIVCGGTDCLDDHTVDARAPQVHPNGIGPVAADLLDNDCDTVVDETVNVVIPAANLIREGLGCAGSNYNPVAADNNTADQYCKDLGYGGFVSWTGGSTAYTYRYLSTSVWSCVFYARMTSLTCYSRHD